MIVTVASRFISTRGDPRFVDVIGDLEKIQRTESNIPLHSSLTHLSAFRRSFPSKVIPDYLREHIPGKERSIGDLGAVLGREMEFSDSHSTWDCRSPTRSRTACAAR